MDSLTRVAPYYDDFDPDKNFAKILFRPEVPVQARELNQLQTILQSQISRFGDNILKQGTIVSGCHINHLPDIPYVKIKDQATDGKAVDVSNLLGKRVIGSNGFTADVVTGVAGFEGNDPDLNTLYVKYTNSGTTGTRNAYDPGEVLTIYDPIRNIEKVTVVSGSAGFTNNDSLLVLPVLSVSNTTGGNTFASGMAVGNRISDGNGANVSINTISFSGKDTFITVKPLIGDQVASNTAAWNLAEGAVFTNATTTQVINIVGIIGTGATGKIQTNGIGAVDSITLVTSGSGYALTPTVYPLSATATSTQLQNCTLAAQNFALRVTVAPSLTSPIGNGYALSIDEGVIYQAGYFTRTDQQLVVVEKYSTNADDKAVGFDTTSVVVTEDDDNTLYDNQYGTPNYLAPGAHRLKLTATAIVLPRAEAALRPEFLSIVELTDGEPFIQTPQTQYNVIEQRLAERTFEESGNYVTDPFTINTKSAPISAEPTSFSLVVDPGTAYISGYRVSTERNYTETLSKATDIKSVPEVPTSVSYGNYIYADRLYGKASGIVGQIVSLRNAAATVASIGAAFATPGTEVGKARVKGIQTVISGTNPLYKLYLFDVSVNSGFAFSQALSVSNVNFAANLSPSYPVALQDPDQATSIIKLPVNAVSNVTNLSYIYQKDNWGVINTSAAGIISLTTSAPETFPVSGSLSQTEIDKTIIIPTNTIKATNPLAGTVSLASGSGTVVGTGTVFSTLTAGRYVQFVNSTASFNTQIVSVANNTSIVVSPTAPANIAGNTHIIFPAGIPLTVNSATVTPDRLSYSADIGTAVPASEVTVASPVSLILTPAAKTVTRNVAVRLNLSTHATTITGPWSIGMSDVIRLRAIYKGANTTFTSVSAGITNITNEFYIDNDQNTDNVGMSYLYKKANTPTTLTTADRLLVVCDILTTSASSGRVLSSYPINDALSLTNSIATINTLEIPEVFGQYEQYYDPRDCIDFRPIATNTITPTTAQATAPINPAEPVYATKYADVGRFPAPGTSVTSDVSYYVGRSDRVVVGIDGVIKTLKGTSDSYVLPTAPVGSITINDLQIPPYPSLPKAKSTELAEIIDTSIQTTKSDKLRVDTYTIQATMSPSEIDAQQPRGYKMTDIGAIDRRLEAVEYYIALSLAETATKNRTIRSSLNANTDRFKFGFFVDSFADTSSTDITHPEYTADIAENVLQARTTRFIVPLMPDDDGTASDGAITLPFSPYTIIDQSSATDGVVVSDSGGTGGTGGADGTGEIVTVPSYITTQVITNSFARNSNNHYDGWGGVTESHNYILSSNAGQAELYFNFRHARNGVEIYQSQSFITSVYGMTPIKNSLAAVGVYGSERSKAYGIDSLDNLQGPYYYGAPLKPALQNTGLIRFNHNPANGRYYKIVITKYKKTSSFHKGGRFQYRFYYPIDNVVTAPVVYNPSGTGYIGSVTSISPATFDNGNVSTGTTQIHYSPAQTFSITINGLKPSTGHTLFMDNADQTNKCIVQGSLAYATVLRSDANGSIVFKFFYTGGTSPALTPYQQLNAVYNLATAGKLISISNSDKSSSVVIVIPNKRYTIPNQRYNLPDSKASFASTNQRGRNTELHSFNLA